MVGAAIDRVCSRKNKPGVDDALGLELLDVVERRSAYDRVLPGHHRILDGDDRQPDARADPVHSGAAASARRHFRPRSRRRRWHFRQSIEYSVSANYADLRPRVAVSRDVLHATISRRSTRSRPAARILDRARASRPEVALAVVRRRRPLVAAPAGGRGGRGGRGGAAAAAAPRPVATTPGGAIGDAVGTFGRGNANTEVQLHAYNDVLYREGQRDPRGYILPTDQPDFLTATKFVNTLSLRGRVRRSGDRGLHGEWKGVSGGSYVMKMDQAARAHVLDMMEPQDHPNDFAYPGGPPLRPYDNAGWTLAYDMGVQFDRDSRSVRRADQAHRRYGEAGRRHHCQR